MLKKCLMLLFLLPALVFADDFVAGKDYQVLSTRAGIKDKPKVIEFFSYGCPWCYRLEKPLDEWLKNKSEETQFKRVPVVFNPDWNNYARAYYTALALSNAENFTPRLFKAIQDEKKPLTSNEDMINFFIRQGISKEVAESAFTHSPAIELQVANGMQLMKFYQVNGVPAFVVNSHYKTDLQMAKDPVRLFRIINYLLKKD